MINLEDARKQIAEFIEFYNTKRLHSSLFYLTPNDYHEGSFDEKLNVGEKKLTEARNKRIKIRHLDGQQSHLWKLKKIAQDLELQVS